MVVKKSVKSISVKTNTKKSSAVKKSSIKCGVKSIKSASAKKSRFDPDKITLAQIKKLNWGGNFEFDRRNFDIINVFAANPKNKMSDRIEAVIICYDKGMGEDITIAEAKQDIEESITKYKEEVAESKKRLKADKYPEYCY